MNKYEKERSREIRDIMRSDRFNRTTYKEAKRKWRKGIRAFRIGDMYAWKAVDIAHLGFSRNKLREVGQAYYKIVEYCALRGLIFDCRYEPYFDCYEMSFRGHTPDGRRFGCRQSVTGVLLRHHSGSVLDITNRVLEMVNDELREFILPSVSKNAINLRTESLYQLS